MKRLITTITLLIAINSYSQDYSYGRIEYRIGEEITAELKAGDIKIMEKEGWIYVTFPGYKVDQWQMKIVEFTKKDGNLFYVCSIKDGERVYLGFHKETNQFVLVMNKTDKILFQQIKKA